MSDSETYLPRPYCTQPRKIGDTCWGCSLVNYGRDCLNNPVAPEENGYAAAPYFSAAETAYNLIMSEFRRRDIATIHDVIVGLSFDGCPPGLDQKARLAHRMDVLQQIGAAVEDELGPLRVEIATAPDKVATGPTSLSEAAGAWDAHVKLLRVFAEYTALNGRPWGHAAPCETQALLTQTLEQALLIQAETPAAWRAAWIDQAREALGKPPAAA